MISGIRAVVLDTNALMMPFQFNINIDREIERLLGSVRVVVPSCVIDELDALGTPEAKGARRLSEKYEVVEVQEKGDQGVQEAAKRCGAAVVTNDQEFIEILRKSSVPVIRMRERQYLNFA